VKIPNPRLIRLGGLTRGAIVEEGDGELIVSPLVQPILELAGPVSRVTINQLVGAAGVPWADSFLVNFREGITGASAQNATVIINTLLRGLWKFELRCTFQFTGTTNAPNSTRLVLIDNGARNLPLIDFGHITGAQMCHEFQTIVMLQDDGFQLQYIRDAVIAGDNTFVSVTLNARKML